MSTEPSFAITFLGETVVSGTRNQHAETRQPTFEGARAALETFYHGFNTHALEPLRQNWLNVPLAQLDYPVGGSCAVRKR